MLVCHCHRVNDRVIRAAARAGAKTTEDVGSACGAGTGCGGCVGAIGRLLEVEHSPGGEESLSVVRAPEPGT